LGIIVILIVSFVYSPSESVADNVITQVSDLEFELVLWGRSYTYVSRPKEQVHAAFKNSLDLLG